MFGYSLQNLAQDFFLGKPAGRGGGVEASATSTCFDDSSDF